MIIRNSKYYGVPSFLLPSLYRCQNPVQSVQWYTRRLHRSTAIAQIPSPTPFVPDPKTFLTLIGRSLSKHAAKIPTWESLFSLSSSQLRALGVEPARNRRYLLWWRDRFRKGEHGIGGDLTNVVDGVGEVRVVEVPIGRIVGAATATATLSPGMKKVVVNLPPDATTPVSSLGDVQRVSGVKVQGAHTIVGPHVEPVKGANGSVARIRVKEGMWEQRRGHKVDGGERRKANVRSRRAAQERGTLR